MFQNDKIQYFIGTDDVEDVLHRVTEDTSWNPSSDPKTYEPSYKDRINQPKYNTGSSTSYEIDIDHVAGNPVQEFLYSIEDKPNTVVPMVRADIFKPQTMSVDSEEVKGYAAKKCDISISMNPIDAEAEGAVHHTGTADMASDGWVYGVAVFSVDRKTCTFHEIVKED